MLLSSVLLFTLVVSSLRSITITITLDLGTGEARQRRPEKFPVLTTGRPGRTTKI